MMSVRPCVSRHASEYALYNTSLTTKFNRNYCSMGRRGELASFDREVVREKQTGEGRESGRDFVDTKRETNRANRRQLHEGFSPRSCKV